MPGRLTMPTVACILPYVVKRSRANDAARCCTGTTCCSMLPWGNIPPYIQDTIWGRFVEITLVTFWYRYPAFGITGALFPYSYKLTKVEDRIRVVLSDRWRRESCASVDVLPRDRGKAGLQERASCFALSSPCGRLGFEPSGDGRSGGSILRSKKLYPGVHAAGR
jgi:hypothetical protein